MPTAVKVPDFGSTVEEVKIICWLKQEGQAVRPGEALCEVETDKANGQLESEAEGVLLRQVAPAGSLVVQGAVIAFIGRAGEAVPEPPPPEQPWLRRPDLPPPAAMIHGPALGAQAEQAAVQPRVPGGRPLGGNQLIIARRVARSHRQIVPYNMTVRLDMSRAIAFRDRVQRESAKRITLDSIFIHALAQVIKKFPRFRTHLVGGDLVTRERINVGFAAGFRDALYILVVHDADGLAVPQVEDEVQRLVRKAAGRQVSVEDLGGACFSISNLGMYPVHSFNVVVPPDQSAALALGTMEDALVLRDGKVTAIPCVLATVTVDHRVINGREAAQFVGRLKEFMEGL